MQTFSAILTQVNTVQLKFSDRINLQQVQDERLAKFVKHCHPSINAEIIPDGTNIRVFTTRGAYIYSCLSGKYFQRVDIEKLSKKYYAIS